MSEPTGTSDTPPTTNAEKDKESDSSRSTASEPTLEDPGPNEMSRKTEGEEETTPTEGESGTGEGEVDPHGEPNKPPEEPSRVEGDINVPADGDVGNEKRQPAEKPHDKPSANQKQEKKKDRNKKTPKKFPDTLEDFGYYFDDSGRLTDMKTGGGFVFDVEPYDHSYNQRRYEALGSVITEHVYKLLEEDGGLKRITLPVDPKKDEPTTFFFMSKDALTNPDKLMILIHGSGAVRAGQWARRLIINDCLDSGTQLPYIRRARENGYAVMVLNTNDNSRNGRSIRGNRYPDDHASYVWDNFVEKSKARRIDIVAHSAGGCATVHLGKSYFRTFEKKVFKIAFTDSVHSLGGGYFSSPSKRVTDFMISHAVNWVSSSEPLGTPIASWGGHGDVQRVSAGTPKHEVTSWSAFEKIFEWFSEPEDDSNGRGNVLKSKSEGKKEGAGGNSRGKNNVGKSQIKSQDNVGRKDKKGKQEGVGASRREVAKDEDKDSGQTGHQNNEEETATKTEDDIEKGVEATEEAT
jgi:hypothetical protein